MHVVAQHDLVTDAVIPLQNKPDHLDKKHCERDHREIVTQTLHKCPIITGYIHFVKHCVTYFVDLA